MRKTMSNTEKALRKRFSALRRKLTRRLIPLKYGKFKENRSLQQFIKEGIPTLRELKTTKEIELEIKRFERALNSRWSSVTKLRKEYRDKIDAYNERGFDFVNWDNIVRFENYIAELREQGAFYEYDSEHVVNFIENLLNVDYDIKGDIYKSFKNWYARVDKKTLNKYIKKTKKSSDDIRKDYQ